MVVTILLTYPLKSVSKLFNSAYGSIMKNFDMPPTHIHKNVSVLITESF